MQIFRDVNALDPNAKLFLNDYEIIERRNKQKATVSTFYLCSFGTKYVLVNRPNKKNKCVSGNWVG